MNIKTKTKTKVDSIYSTALTIGTSTNTDGYILFDNGQANKPGIKLNTATSKIQYSNDGSAWADISESAATLGGDISGSNIISEYSRDRYIWEQFNSSTITSIFTTAPNQIGLTGWGYNTTASHVIQHFAYGSL